MKTPRMEDEKDQQDISLDTQKKRTDGGVEQYEDFGAGDKGKIEVIQESLPENWGSNVLHGDRAP